VLRQIEAEIDRVVQQDRRNLEGTDYHDGQFRLGGKVYCADERGPGLAYAGALVACDALFVVADDTAVDVKELVHSMAVIKKLDRCVKTDLAVVNMFVFLRCSSPQTSPSF